MRQKTRHLRSWIIVVQAIILGCLASRLFAADEAVGSGKTKPRANRLAKETSPYLLLHANNPVDWYPWCPEAFQKAKKEGKLIFLSVGYSSCYWCHVMERKVFTNEAIAKMLNQDFVCIKVDREERPDVDDIYMTSLQIYYQAIGAPASGGWPLSMFLTPDGKPVAGGTYFPPDDTDGNQGFPSILEKISDMWKNKHDQMMGNADILANETRRLMRPKMSLKPIEINQSLAETVFDSLASSIDPEFGGIDFNLNQPDGPKFPTPAKLTFIQQQLRRTSNDEVSALVDLTLMQMACGGIRDHIGGGFHRYSVDRRWDVPHFEKMLYDQAQLADVFVEGYRATQRSLYKQVAEELFDFVGRELTSPEGGFYSALDAETNGVEGEYYVWEASEINNVLGAAATNFKSAYRVKDLADFEHGNVLRLSSKKLPSAAELDTLVGATTPAGSERDEFTVSRMKLLDVRNKRKKPLRDEKILACWNGLMIGAYARAALHLQHLEYAKTAERAAEFVLTKLRDPQGRLQHAYAAGESRFNAYLDDYAFVIDGLLALHDVTEDPKWLKSAKQLQDDQLRMFLDENNGGFFFTSHQHEELLARIKSCYDGVLPAGNSVSARNMIKLSKRTGNSAYHDEARATVELFAANIELAPRGLANLALAVTELLESEVVEKSDAKDDSKKVIPASGTDKNEKSEKVEPLILLADQKGQPAKKDDLVKGRAYLSTDKLPAGGTCQIVVLLDVKEGWHIQANPPDPENMKATTIGFKSVLGTKLSEIKYPKGHKAVPADPSTYDGEVAIRGTLEVLEKAGGQIDDMEITITYQPCNDETCLAPKTIKLTGKLAVAKRGEAIKPINARLFPAETEKKK